MNKAPPLPMPTEADLKKLKKIKDVIDQEKVRLHIMLSTSCSTAVTRLPIKRFLLQVEKPIAKVEVKPVTYVPVKPNDPCPLCRQSLGNGAQITVVDGAQEYHTACFVCFTCKSTFGPNYWPHDGKPYCLPHYCAVRGLVCARCSRQIDEGTAINALGRTFHLETWCDRCLLALARETSYHQLSPQLSLRRLQQAVWRQLRVLRRRLAALLSRAPASQVPSLRAVHDAHTANDQSARTRLSQRLVGAAQWCARLAADPFSSLACVKCRTPLGNQVYDHRGQASLSLSIFARTLLLQLTRGIAAAALCRLRDATRRRRRRRARRARRVISARRVKN